MRFGNFLKNRRQELKISVQNLATNIGVSRSYITLMENNRRLPGKPLLPKLAEALNLKVNILINWYLEDLRWQLSDNGDFPTPDIGDIQFS